MIDADVAMRTSKANKQHDRDLFVWQEPPVMTTHKMAFRLPRLARWSAQYPKSLPSITHFRHIHATTTVSARERVSRQRGDRLDDDDIESIMDGYEDVEEGGGGGGYLNDDTTTLGHEMLNEHRQTLYYMRLIEHEMPNLVGKLAVSGHLFRFDLTCV